MVTFEKLVQSIGTSFLTRSCRARSTLFCEPGKVGCWGGKYRVFCNKCLPFYSRTPCRKLAINSKLKTFLVRKLAGKISGSKKEILTQSNNAKGITTNPGATKGCLLQLFRTCDFLALFDHICQPKRSSVQVQNQAHCRVSHLLHAITGNIANGNPEFSGSLKLQSQH